MIMLHESVNEMVNSIRGSFSSVFNMEFEGLCKDDLSKLLVRPGRNSSVVYNARALDSV